MRRRCAFVGADGAVTDDIDDSVELLSSFTGLLDEPDEPDEPDFVPPVAEPAAVAPIAGFDADGAEDALDDALAVGSCNDG